MINTMIDARPTPTALQDRSARDQAIDPSGSYGVSAPAGSGKTELLIQRTLSLLAQVEHPESILGITFTRKAANEMRERVIRALEKANLDEPVSSQHERLTLNLAAAVLKRNNELQWGLLENPSRLRFQTIDGLCRQLANQLCLETGIVVPPSMSDDSKALYSLAAERVLDFIEEKNAVGDALRLLVKHLDGNLQNLVDLIADLLSSRDSWLGLMFSQEIDSEYLRDRIEALIEESLIAVQQLLAPYSSDINGLLDYAVAHKEGADYLSADLNIELPDSAVFNLGQWKAIRAFFITGASDQAKYRSAKGLNKRMGFPTESDQADKATARQRKQEYAALIAAFEENPKILHSLNRLGILPDLADPNDVDPNADPSIDGRQQTQANQITAALFNVLPLAAAAFNTLCQEVGETDFTAVAIAAIEALGQTDNPTPLALRLDYRIQHILVDEFQDTSRVQIDLLERLTAGWQPDDGRTLFIVGDGMQSIYGFRKANVSLFIRARREGIGDIHITPLDLTANFRSDSQIVDWVNQSFVSLFPEQDNLVQGQVAFKAAESVKPSSDWHIDLHGYASAAQEAAAIAADIDAKLSDSDASLAILVRGRRHLEAILPELRAHQISWQAQDIDPLANRMAVMDIHSLTRALCVPADRIAWLALLRAPWAGLDMSDLLHLCEWKTDKETAQSFPTIWQALQSADDISQLSDQGKRIASRLRVHLQQTLSQIGRQPLRDLIEALWRDLDGPAGLLEDRDQKDVEDYLQLIERVETGGMIPDWQALNRRLNELYSQPDLALKTVAGKSDDARLQIMTIHKSKGLEFDHVYLPGLGRTTGRNEDPLLLWWQREYEDGSEGYLLAAKAAAGSNQSDKNHQSLYDYLKAEESARQRQETARLLYVACTRARKSLFLSATLSWDEKKEQVKKPPGNSMLAALWDLYSESFSDGFQPLFETEQKQTAIIDGIRRLDPERPINGLAVCQDQPSAETDAEPSTYLYSDNYLARISGDLIHHSLMRIVREDIVAPDKEQFLSDWQSGVSSIGLSVPQQTDIIEKLEQMLAAILSDQTGRWILDTSHSDSAAELEIDYLDAHGSVQLAIIDRTFIEHIDNHKSQRWIIDYKSSSPKIDEPLNDFLKRQADTYRAQMHRYLSLFDGADTINRAMLYFPAISASVEVERL